MTCSRTSTRRQELAVVVVEHDVLDADPAARFPRLRAAPCGQRAAALGLMTGVAVRHRRRIGRGDRARRAWRRASGALIAVVRMGAESDHVELAVGAPA